MNARGPSPRGAAGATIEPRTANDVRERAALYNVRMPFNVAHGFEQESPEAKARWFQSLTTQERMELFCDYTELVLTLNPRIADHKNAEQTARGVRILELPRP